MNFEQILHSLDLLADESSTLGKQHLLNTMMKDKEFQNVLQLALDAKLSFKVAKLPVPRENVFSSAAQFNERETFSVLKTFATQRGVSDMEKLELAGAVRKLTGATEVVNRIVKKDLRCGVKAALVNKVVPGFIKIWPYMRCKSHSEKNFKKIKYPAIAQLKADGTHIDIKKENGEITFHSRIGNEYDFLGELTVSAEKIFKNSNDDGVFIGEGVVLDENGHVLDRKTGNGIITKALHGTIAQEEASRIRVQLWEYVQGSTFFGEVEGYLEYEDSLSIVEQQTEGLVKITPIESQIVENYEEVLAYYKHVKSRGLEGLVVKNFSGVFKSTNTGSPNQVKVKAVLGEEYESEFRVVGINPGKEGTRFEHGIGSLQYESEDGKIVGNVGSGFSHEERDTWGTEVIGGIITIRFDDLVNDKRDPDKFSLYAPRFIEFREKEEADDLAYVKILMDKS